ncbi:MAG: hypothetical protein GY774_37880 [Planctomycetes bacterium]|nr:hypothetical protein [Planctomycetota bacterium]
MSENSNQVGMVAVIEPIAGTRTEPISTDSDVVMWGDGQPTINFNNASLGKLADGSMNDAPVAGGMQTITFPDRMMELQHAGGDGTTEPKNWKYPKMCGATSEIVSTRKALVFDGTPSCTTGSVDSKGLGCDGKATLYKGRGCRGNMTISWDGSNAPMIMTVTSLQGALVSESPLTGETPYEVIGEDSANAESVGNYVFTVGSTVYQMVKGEFDYGASVTMESANNESGVAQAKIAGGLDMRFKGTVIKLSDGADTIYEKAKNNEKFDLTGVGGVGAGYDITFTDCQLLDPSLGDVDGTTSWDIETTLKRAEFLQKDLP